MYSAMSTSYKGKMARSKKDGVSVSYFIRRDVKEKLDDYCEEVGQTATMAIERILDDFLTKVKPIF